MRNLLTYISLMLGLFCLCAFSRSEEYGYASIYSQRFEGSRTANGELFNHAKLTAAHKTLPFGTQLRVTRLDNGKSVVVRINDRGPFIENRVTDLSQAAATVLGFNYKIGEVKVKLEVVGNNGGTKKVETSSSALPVAPESVPNLAVPNAYGLVSKGAPKSDARNLPRDPKSNSNSTALTNNEPKKAIKKTGNETIVNGKSYQSQQGTYRITLTRPPKNGYAVQVSSMRNNDNMLRKTAELQELYFRNVLVNVEKSASGEPFYRILVGPFEDKTSAANCQKTLHKRNIDGFIVDLSK